MPYIAGMPEKILKSQGGAENEAKAAPNRREKESGSPEQARQLGTKTYLYENFMPEALPEDKRSKRNRTRKKKQSKKTWALRRGIEGGVTI